MIDVVPVHQVARIASWIPYIGLAIFPTAAFAPFNLVRFSWGYRHGLQTMPEGVRERAETVDRYIWPLTNLLILTPVVILMNYLHVSAAAAGLHLDLWKLNAALGVSAGFILVVIQGLLRTLVTPEEEAIDDTKHTGGHASLWCLIFLFGAFSEELWLAFCLVALRHTNHSIAFSILLTAIAISLAHFPYGFGAFATACLGAVSGILFLWTGSLLPSFLFHFIGNIGTLYWARRGPAPTAPGGV